MLRLYFSLCKNNIFQEFNAVFLLSSNYVSYDTTLKYEELNYKEIMNEIKKCFSMAEILFIF